MTISRTLVALAIAGVLTIGGLAGPGAPPATAARADHDLVFLVDGSGSIDSADWTLQLQGFAAALQDGVNFPLNGSISVSVVQWAAGTPRVEIPLTNLDSKAALENVVATVGAIRQMNSGTSPGDGIRAGVDELALNGRTGAHRTLCMSTDGERNGGEALASATAYAKTKSVDKYTVVAIEDGSFKAASATRAYGPYVFGGGTVTTARTTAEFTSLISGCIAEASTLEALEVTQSTQDLYNSVPLVAGKNAVVRAYLSKTGDAQRTSGRLRGYREGVELDGSPLPALNTATGILVDDDYLADRKSLSGTLNFALPSSWESGTVDLVLELPGGVTCATPAAGGVCSETVSFEQGMDYRVMYRGFSWTDANGEHSVSRSKLYEQHYRAISQLPVGAQRSVGVSAIEIDTKPYDLYEANGILHMAEAFRDDPQNSAHIERWYGVIPGIPGQAGEGGLAYQKTAAHWEYDDGPRTYFGHGRNRVVHELSHTYGVEHTVSQAQNGNVYLIGKAGWCGEEGSPYAPDWPYWYTETTTSGSKDYPTSSNLLNVRGQAWGFDTRFASEGGGLVISDPHDVRPLMSYCGSTDPSSQQRWITPLDYEHLLGDDLAPIGILGDPVAPADGPTGLLVRGIITLDTQAVAMNPALIIPAQPTISDGAGTHELVVLDTLGSPLHTLMFTPTSSAGDPEVGGSDGPRRALMNVVIPADLPGAATVELRTGGVTLSSTALSATTPTASIGVPTTGTSEEVDVAWSSSDADADTLHHTLLYSTDGGGTWDVIAADLSGTSTSIARWVLPASDHAKLKVIVSDGLRSSEAISAEFSLPNLAPTLTIAEPLDGTTVSGSQMFALDAGAYDAEDGELDNGSFEWSSDRDGVLGAGARLLMRADGLSEGTHVLTVTVTDSAGAQTSASVTVHVNRVAEVPVEAAMCTVAYQVHGTAPGTFTTQVTILNTGSETIDGWALAWTFSNGEAVVHHWSSAISDGPSGVTATNLSWNASIAAGGSVTFGFNGSIADGASPAVPDEFRLNGGLCQ